MLTPPWTLTGGGALAGVHLGHRETRDLDLFWRNRADVLGVRVAVDTPHEILVNKLTALLGRSELRDLVDVKALLDAGGDLDRALADAPRKDGGFSPLTLAWVLKGFDPRPLARALGWGEAATDEIVSFQRWLVERLTAASAPE